MLMVWAGYLYVVTTIGIVTLFSGKIGLGVIILLFGVALPGGLAFWIMWRRVVARRAAAAELRAAANAEDADAKPD